MGIKIDKLTRRNIIKSAAWSTPVIMAVSLPLHAQTSATAVFVNDTGWGCSPDSPTSVFDEGFSLFAFRNASGFSVAITSITFNVTSSAIAFYSREDPFLTAPMSLPITLADGEYLVVRVLPQNPPQECRNNGPATYEDVANIVTECCGIFSLDVLLYF